MPHPRPAGRLCFTCISLSHLVLSCIILYYLVLACIILYYIVLSCNALPVPSSYRFGSPSVFLVFYKVFKHFGKTSFPNYQKVAKRSIHSSKINILLFSSLRLCLPMPSYALFFLFAALLSLFKIEQNARDIRQKRSPWPRLVRKTPNLSKTLCFYSKNWPPGSKT